MSLDTISALPFAGISVDELVFLQNDYNSCQQKKFHQFDELKFESFKYSDYSAHDQESNIDPENNFYNYISSNCRYYSDQQFNKTFVYHKVLLAEVYRLFILTYVV